MREHIDPRHAELVAMWRRIQEQSRDGDGPVRGIIIPPPKR